MKTVLFIIIAMVVSFLVTHFVIKNLIINPSIQCVLASFFGIGLGIFAVWLSEEFG